MLKLNTASLTVPTLTTLAGVPAAISVVVVPTSMVAASPLSPTGVQSTTMAAPSGNGSGTLALTTVNGQVVIIDFRLDRRDHKLQARHRAAVDEHPPANLGVAVRCVDDGIELAADRRAEQRWCR